MDDYFLKFEDRTPEPPLPYSASRELLWQSLATVALVVGAWYIWWRWTASLNTEAMWFSGTAASVLAQQDALQQTGDVILKRAETLAKEAGQNLSSTKLLTGPTAQAILEAADTVNADLIVCGRRGFGNLKAMFLGSVSQQLTSEAECAVLTVKAAQLGKLL